MNTKGYKEAINWYKFWEWKRRQKNDTRSNY